MRLLHSVPLCATLAVIAAGCDLSGGTGNGPRATRLAFVATPTHVRPYEQFDPALVVVAQDEDGVTITSFDDSVTLSSVPIAGLPWARVSGTVKVKAVAGIATFDDAQVMESADGYVLVASSGTLEPAMTDAFDANDFQELVAGASHFCLITDRRKTYCWGLNADGQLGDGTTDNRPAPVRIAPSLSFDSLAAGDHHTCALDVGGAAYCWGRNDSGQLGDGTTTQRLTPVPVSGGLVFVDIVVAGTHSCGRTAAGAAYCWGWNGDGEPGERTTPTLVTAPEPFKQIAARRTEACGMVADGGVQCWTADSLVALPAVFESLGHLDLWAAFDRMCIRQMGSTMYCWPPDGGPPTLTPIPTFTARVTLGAQHICVTTYAVGSCWGANASGQIGDGTRVARTTPFDLQEVVGGIATYKIAASEYATCALVGRLRCWGSNANGQLGLGALVGAPADRLVPTIAAFP